MARCCLVGNGLTRSTVIGDWDEHERAEEGALAELADLLDQVRVLDPPAFGDGGHETRVWPAELDRWLH